MIERVTSQNLTNLQKEILPAKTDIFINNYLVSIATPLTLLNHVGPITFNSRHIELSKRQEALSDYFSRYTPKDHIPWGRSIFSEIVSTKILNSIFEEGLHNQNMQFNLVPTDFDRSSSPLEKSYQKGADICLTKRVIYENQNYLLPICGFDVTVGGRDMVNKKRKKPGLQSKAAIPVVVLPLKELGYRGHKEDFIDYLDKQGKDSVKNCGDYRPFYGLTGLESRLWKRRLSEAIIEGSRLCRKKLMRNDDTRVNDFPYMSHVNRQLNFMENFVKTHR